MATDIKTRTVARLVLAELGVRAADLRAPLTAPTIAEFMPRVIEAASPGTRRTYGSYWTRAVERMGDHRLDEIVTSDQRLQAARYRDRPQATEQPRRPLCR